MKSCLIVDDSRVIRKVARQIFEALDFMKKQNTVSLLWMRARKDAGSYSA